MSAAPEGAGIAATEAAIPAVAYVAIGSNIDDPLRQVRQSFDELASLPGTRLLRASSIYRTPPVGYADQPDFYNAVAALETALPPHALLDALLDLEQARGRVRLFQNGPRVVDLDVLLYGDREIGDARLQLPHPRMHTRAFVLYPLHEIAPDCRIPGRGGVAELKSRCDSLGIERVAARHP